MVKDKATDAEKKPKNKNIKKPKDKDIKTTGTKDQKKTKDKDTKPSKNTQETHSTSPKYPSASSSHQRPDQSYSHLRYPVPSYPPQLESSYQDPSYSNLDQSEFPPSGPISHQVHDSLSEEHLPSKEEWVYYSPQDPKLKWKLGRNMFHFITAEEPTKLSVRMEKDGVVEDAPHNLIEAVSLIVGLALDMLEREELKPFQEVVWIGTRAVKRWRDEGKSISYLYSWNDEDKMKEWLCIFLGKLRKDFIPIELSELHSKTRGTSARFTGHDWVNKDKSKGMAGWDPLHAGIVSLNLRVSPSPASPLLRLYLR
jgi:hypothetical protein